MTDQRELDLLLDAFFVEGTDELADRVIDDALDEIDHTQQRQVLRPPRRFSTMTISTRLAAAAVIGVLAVGGIFLVSRPDLSTVASPSPTPGVSARSDPTTSPSVTQSLAVAPPAAPGWTATGSMTAPRGGQSTVLLQDGRVLAVGGPPGFYSGGPIHSADVYDPASGSWTATGPLVHDGDGTPTVLQDGRVLVVGSAGGDAPRSAELLDPATGTWSATGRMIDARSITSATLLRDGTVLVIGIAGSDDHSSAALYDPGTGHWTVAGSMIATRGTGTATLLTDGNVLWIPSDYRGDPTQLYHPPSRTWTATGDLFQTRQLSTATLLPDGKVLVTGGIKLRSDTIAVASAEVYDPATGTWTATGDMLEPRAGHTATLLQDGTVLVAGAVYPGTTTSAELYHPEIRGLDCHGKHDPSPLRDRDPVAGREGARNGRHTLRRHPGVRRAL